MKNIIQNRFEFVYFFDVENGNPNGDPDAGNMPRIDPETNHGLVTDVCLKRKIRNYVGIVKGETPPFEIYVKEKAVLNQQHKKAYINNPEIEMKENKLPNKEEEAQKITGWMCQNFFDIRTFGAVMSTKINCGQVRGPVQMNFARSLDPIIPIDVSITRMAITDEKELDEGEEGKKKKKDKRTMGRKSIVPYALYRAEGYVSAHFAAKTGFTEEDSELLWEALIHMFDHDHSAARGKMNARKLFIFSHASPLGNAPAHKLFSLIKTQRLTPEGKPIRHFEDYEILADKSLVPEGIVLNERL